MTEQEKKIILIVEDDQSILFLLEYIFNKDFNVITAKNGKEAFEKVSEQLPDVIVSDIMMPEMNGIDFKILLNENPETLKIPFIFLTADLSNKDRASELENAFLFIKPVKPIELKQKVKELLSN